MIVDAGIVLTAAILLWVWICIVDLVIDINITNDHE